MVKFSFPFSLLSTIVGSVVVVVVVEAQLPNCPAPKPGSIGTCVEECNPTSQTGCHQGDICCSNGCGHECIPDCPVVPPGTIVICVEQCNFQQQTGCDIGYNCCSNGCGHVCTHSYDPGMEMDPHLLNWAGEWFDYMGECDLVLISDPEFAPGTSLDVHVRTTIRYDYSYIEAAALRIGDDIFEVDSFGSHALNGVEGATGTEGGMPEVGSFPVYHTQVNQKKHLFDIVTGPKENITISTYKDMVSVNFKGVTKDHFGKVSGMLGSIDGTRYARDGTTILHDDINAFGQEWQVTDQEDNLFRVLRAPQYPERCRLPGDDTSASKIDHLRRHLGENKVNKEGAKEACARYTGHSQLACIHDVMSTGDLDIAVDGVY